MDSLEEELDEFDEGYHTVNYPIQFMITHDYRLVLDRAEADFLICGDERVGYVQVRMSDAWYEPIVYH